MFRRWELGKYKVVLEHPWRTTSMLACLSGHWSVCRGIGLFVGALEWFFGTGTHCTQPRRPGGTVDVTCGGESVGLLLLVCKWSPAAEMRVVCGKLPGGLNLWKHHQSHSYIQELLVGVYNLELKLIFFISVEWTRITCLRSIRGSWSFDLSFGGFWSIATTTRILRRTSTRKARIPSR